MPKCDNGLNRIILDTRGVAAVGNVYTKPDRRGRGYARAVTSAIIKALRTDGYGLNVLNVDKRNTAARSLYERLQTVDLRHLVDILGVARQEANGRRRRLAPSALANQNIVKIQIEFRLT